MKLMLFCLAIACALVAACGGSAIPLGGSGGGGGSGGVEPPPSTTTYTLSCRIGSVMLVLPIELSIVPDGSFTPNRAVEVAFSPSFTIDEPAVAVLSDQGIEAIDIISASMATDLSGALPRSIQTSLEEAPINDFDLLGDPDDNGIAGPHRFDLQIATEATTVFDQANEVEFVLKLDGVSLVLGDFEVPRDCLAPSLVGFAVSFPVE